MKQLTVSISDELAETLADYCRDNTGDPMLTVTVESALTQYLAGCGYYGPFRPLSISSVEPENGTNDQIVEQGDAPGAGSSIDLSEAPRANHAEQDTRPAPWTLDEATLRQRLAEREYRPATEPFRFTSALIGSGFTDVSIEHDRYLAEAIYSDRHGSDLRDPGPE